VAGPPASGYAPIRRFTVRSIALEDARHAAETRGALGCILEPLRIGCTMGAAGRMRSGAGAAGKASSSATHVNEEDWAPWFEEELVRELRCPTIQAAETN
jgi:hypothetical protein